MPKVSIVLPVYNVKPFIREALDSVINQTMQDIEIICVDDCSTDGSLEVLEEYAQKDSRIKVIKQDINQGEVVAKYVGALEAQSEYVATLDPDDYYSLDFCEVLYNEIIKNNADAACCNRQNISEDGKIRKGQIFQVTTEDKCIKLDESYINKINPATTNKIMKKDICLNSLNFKDRDILKDFYQYWRGFTFDNYTVCLVNQALYFYRKRKSSIIHTKVSYKEKWNSYTKTVDLILNYLQENKKYELYKQAFWINVAKAVKKMHKRRFNYNNSIKELQSIAYKYSIPEKDLLVFDSNRLKIFFIGR